MSDIKVTTAKLVELASTCRRQAGQVKQVKTTVGSAIRSSGWKSPAAQRFENDWNTHYVKALSKLEVALEELGAAAGKMAKNYDATEAAYKGMS